MFKLNIHGVPFYGRYNEHHYKSLFKVAKITSKNEWKGVKGVYCVDGVSEFKKEGEVNAGLYARWQPKHKGSLTITMSYNDGGKEIFSPYGSPIIIVKGSILKREEDFVFTLLHELGHHVNRKEEINQTTKEKEIEAHIFALNKYFQRYQNLNMLNYYYIEDALIKSGYEYTKESAE